MDYQLSALLSYCVLSGNTNPFTQDRQYAKSISHCYRHPSQKREASLVILSLAIPVMQLGGAGLHGGGGAIHH